MSKNKVVNSKSESDSHSRQGSRSTEKSPQSPKKRQLGRWLIALLLILIVGGLTTFFIYQTNHGDISSIVGSTEGGGDDFALVSVPGKERQKTALDTLVGKHDAKADDWDTEVLNDAAGKQLKALKKLILHPETLDLEHVSKLVTAEFTSHKLRPVNLEKSFGDDNFQVHRFDSPADPDPVGPDNSVKGAGGFLQTLQEMESALGPDSEDRHLKFKLFRVEKSEQYFMTRIFVEISSRVDSLGVQQNATWLCKWSYPGAYSGSADSNQQALLIWIGVKKYEEITIKKKPGSLFVDCTESVMGRNASYKEQMLPGITYWLSRLSREFMDRFGHHGFSIGDINGDGLEDLYLCETGGLPNRVYLHQKDGTVVDVSSQSGVNFLDDSISSLLLDLDNDGDQDLTVATNNLLWFAENDGTGKFTIRGGHEAASDSFSICSADYNQDGNLDIYICGYNLLRQDPLSGGLPFPVPYHDANNGGHNVLFRNDGGFNFTDVTRETGLDVDNSRFTQAACWEDFDNDGDQDLYLANDFGRNCLYRNDDGNFTNIALQADVEDIASGMSVSWADWNRDGLQDVYVSNMFSAAGNRVTFQRRFEDVRGDESKYVQRMARGNTLFTNMGNNTFVDDSESTGVTMGRWAWGSKFTDLNNDGWQDLIVTNGYVTSADPGDL